MSDGQRRMLSSPLCLMQTDLNKKTQLSRLAPGRVSAAAAQYVRSALAPVDQVLYTEAKERFATRRKPFEDRIRAYEATQPEPTEAEWHACSAQSDAFERGMRVGQDVLSRSTGEVRNLVLVPRGQTATHCTPCGPPELRTANGCRGFY